MSNEVFYQSCIGDHFKKIIHLPEFEKDLKKLLKTYRTLEEDLQNLIRFGLFNFHKLKNDNQGIVRIANLGISRPIIYKARKIACRALKGGAQSGLRMIYAYYEEEDKVELIELYFKGDKPSENRERIEYAI